MNKITGTMVIFSILLTCFSGLVTISPLVVESQYILHEPILIEGDEDFREQAVIEGWPGDGIEGNPYIIENYEISIDKNSGIEIKETTVHFVIRDSIFKRAGISNKSVKTYWQSGINLDRVKYGNIINCILENNKHGIDLYDSEDILISNNTMINNGIRITGWDLEDFNSLTIDVTNRVNGKPIYYWKNRDSGVIPQGAGQVILVNCTNIVIEGQNIDHVSVGIHLEDCVNNRIYRNNITANSHNGIYIHNSIYNTISENKIISNENEGIFLFNSDDKILLNNNISMNNANGILIGQSSGNNITENLIFSNNRYGVHIYSSLSGNIISKNIVSDNNFGGIFLEQSDGNNLINNNIANNNIGIYIHKSNENVIQANSMKGDGIFIEGYLADSWTSNTITTTNTVNEKPIYFWKDRIKGNIPSDAGQVILANCTNIIIEDQDLSYSYIAIQLVYSSSVNIINITANYNNEYGFYLWQSNLNTIANSTVSSGGYGIYLEKATENTIIYNTISSNTFAGIKLFRANNNTFHHNSIMDNDLQISLVGSMMNTWNDDNLEGNYWGDYIGIDQDGDGVGDTELPHNGVDNFPLTDREGTDFDESLLFLLIYITILIITLIIVILVLKKRKSKGESSGEVEGVPPREL